jgi:Ca2+-binding EF-hand superfamily protein
MLKYEIMRDIISLKCNYEDYEEFKQILQTMPISEDNSIDYEEFIVSILERKKEQCKESLFITFRNLRVDMKALLKLEDVENIFDTAGNSITEKHWEEIKKEINSSKHKALTLDHLTNELEKVIVTMY